MPSTKTLREGSTPKRAAILAAARELFLANGFDRSSVDAVAARAEVSKRTVYDYFGDKRTLLQAVVDTVGESLVTTIRRILDDTLTDVADLTETADLEDVLVAFSMRIATDMLGSAEYATLQRLVRTQAGSVPEGERTRWPTPPTRPSPSGSPPSPRPVCSTSPTRASRRTSSSR
ncbi:TetR/AcrR family transcriptional regulator [Streptomyces sp. NB004]